MQPDVLSLVERLRSLLRSADPEELRAALEDERPEDLADAMTRMEPDEIHEILVALDEMAAATVLIEMPTETAREIIQDLPDTTLAVYLDILPMDDAIDLREELGEDRFDALLEVIPKKDAQEIRRLLAYPEGTVGRIMTESFFRVSPDYSMQQILDDIRLAPDDKYEMVNDIYVLSEHDHLLGIFSLRKAIRARPNVLARDLMREEVITCLATDDEEDAARMMARYGFYALPVLDRNGKMVGIFTGDDAQTILREAETEDVLALGAVSGDAEAYLSLNEWQLVKRRLPWLLILFVAEMLTGSVLRHYIGTQPDGPAPADQRLALIAQLTLFIPLLIGAGGNSGSQVTTTITRALAVGEITAREFWTVIRREFLVALMVGSALGLVGYLRAAFWWNSGAEISLIVGLALPAIVIWATTVGSMLPLAAKRLGIDPAVMSAPFITTFVDATGLIIYFEIARRVLPVLAI